MKKVQQISEIYNSLQGKTILERFQEYCKKQMNPSPMGITGFISIENARMLSKIPVNMDDEKECYEFVEYFYDTYGENEKVLDAVEGNWLDEPLIFRLAEQYVQDVVADEEENEDIGRLAEYIFKIRADRYLTVGKSKDITQYFIPATIPKKELDDVRESLYAIIADMFQEENTAMILRLRFPNGEKDILNGFKIVNGNLTKIPIPVLKRNSELQPDGSIIQHHDTDYQVAFVRFKN